MRVSSCFTWHHSIFFAPSRPPLLSPSLLHLWDHGNRAPEGGEADLGDVHAVDLHAPMLHLHQPQESNEERGLARTRASDNPDFFLQVRGREGRREGGREEGGGRMEGGEKGREGGKEGGRGGREGGREGRLLEGWPVVSGDRGARPEKAWNRGWEEKREQRRKGGRAGVPWDGWRQ